MSDSEPDESTCDAAPHTYLFGEYYKFLKRMKYDNADIGRIINIGSLPKDSESVMFKNQVESERLSTRIKKKENEINNRYNTLNTMVDQLKTLLDQKNAITGKNIQATKEYTSIKIGYLSKKLNETKSAMNKQFDEIEKDKVREETEIDKELQEAIVILVAMMHDKNKQEMQEQEAEERSRISHEIKKKKAEQVREKERIESEIKQLKDEIERAYVVIQNMRDERDKETNILQEENTKMALEKKSLEEAIATLSTAKAELQEKILGLKNQIDSLKRQNETEINEIEIILPEAVVRSEKALLRRTVEEMRDEFEIIKEIEKKILSIGQDKKNINAIKIKILEVKAELKNIKIEEVLAKINLEKDVKALQIHLKKTEDEFKKNVQTMKEYMAQKFFQLNN